MSVATGRIQVFDPHENLASLERGKTYRVTYQPDRDYRNSRRQMIARYLGVGGVDNRNDVWSLRPIAGTVSLRRTDIVKWELMPVGTKVKLPSKTIR